MRIDESLNAGDLRNVLHNFFDVAGPKILALNQAWDPGQGAPVFTARGDYTARGWTEWTQGFQYGCQLLQFDATGDKQFLKQGRENTFRYMAPHVSHIGVHDHGFNNVSTYGTLRRLALEGRTDESDDAIAFYEMALKTSGAVQAARWTPVRDGGYIHSFNGPHSLFVDTIRSCRALVLAHRLGHVLMGENDEKISLLGRAILHLKQTAAYNVFYGEGRDSYDLRGRTVHECIFNVKDGRYRCPSTQQGYSPFSTWTRGLAWAMLGCAEEMEFLVELPEEEFEPFGGKKSILDILMKAARATCDFYIDNTANDGIPYWDTGAPALSNMPGWRDAPSDPDNEFEPVDSSAAAIGAQGLLRLGKILGEDGEGARYWRAGLGVSKALFGAPYLSEATEHQGLILHSIYHRPNGWDYIPEGKTVPQGESSMWGDYHAMELAVYLKRIIEGEPYLTFNGPTIR